MTSILFLALASYLSLYPALLLPPLILLCYDRSIQLQYPQKEQEDTEVKTQPDSQEEPETVGAEVHAGPSIWTFTAKHVALFAASVGYLLYLSRLLTGSWAFISSTYGVQLLLPDLTPNVGLWWYFFIEMFDSFREFFLGVFWLHLGGYVGGLSIRLRKQPLFVITTLMGIFAVFKPYPSVGDTGVYLSMLMLYRHVFPCKHCPSPFTLIRSTTDGAILMLSSNALHIPLPLHNPLHLPPRTSLLPSLDLRRFRQRQLLLRHHAGLEFRTGPADCRLHLCGLERRVGGRETGDEGEGSSPDIAISTIHLHSPSQ